MAQSPLHFELLVDLISMKGLVHRVVRSLLLLPEAALPFGEPVTCDLHRDADLPREMLGVGRGSR